jgi:hypothetical protein
MILTILIWYNVFFYLFIGQLILFLFLGFYVINVIRKKNLDVKLIQQQHSAKIDNIRKEHSITLENIRIEMLKREEERTRQWAESEKETLQVLSGISTFLDLTEKIGIVDTDKIILILNEMKNKLNLPSE